MGIVHTAGAFELNQPGGRIWVGEISGYKDGVAVEYKILSVWIAPEQEVVDLQNQDPPCLQKHQPVKWVFV